ncbi:MAG: histidine phosphatase family protein [Candidatus Obscuribacterales bacterium]|nr:histidine phosphatase family protein [Candidatus Obscuribacterales bacterium]
MSETLHPEEKITSIIFVRHGHTEQTEKGQLYSDPKAALTERGKQQAESVANWIVKEQPELLLASPADRVRSTAAIVASALNLSINIVAGLDEQHVGDWESRSYLEIKKSQPELYKQWCEDPIRNAPPNGESIIQLYERIAKDINKLVAEHNGNKIILVTHAGVIKSAIIDALQMPIDNFWRLNIPTGSASKIDYTSNFATLQYASLRF